MQGNVDIKRGTTPTLPITIFMPFENVKHIDFIFKKQIDDKAPKLLEMGFDFPDNENLIHKENNSFVIDVEFEEEQTRKLVGGEIYMDTRIVLTNNKIPPTEIVPLDIGKTLYGEAYNK